MKCFQLSKVFHDKQVKIERCFLSLWNLSLNIFYKSKIKNIPCIFVEYRMRLGNLKQA
jgi:hypothetical protein